jgi:hypothetical protein
MRNSVKVKFQKMIDDKMKKFESENMTFFDKTTNSLMMQSEMIVMNNIGVQGP